MHPEKTPEVPLTVYGDKSPVYCASVAMTESMRRDIYGFTKKPPTAEEMRMYHPKKDSFNPEGESQGIHRAWLEEVITIQPQKIIFECQGNKEALWNILSQVRRIGVFRRAGMGEVIRMHIEPVNNPYAGLIYDDQPARMLPVADWPDKPWRKIYAAVRALIGIRETKNFAGRRQSKRQYRI